MATDYRDRQVGESYKDYAARMAGMARAAEQDRDAARARVAELKDAGQYLADVLRAGSTGNHTASQLGALDRWEAALDAAPAPRNTAGHPADDLTATPTTRSPT